MWHKSFKDELTKLALDDRGTKTYPISRALTSPATTRVLGGAYGAGYGAAGGALLKGPVGAAAGAILGGGLGTLYGHHAQRASRAIQARAQKGRVAKGTPGVTPADREVIEALRKARG